MANASKMRHTITFETRSDALTEFRQQSESWATASDPIWANVRTLEGRELLAALQVRAEVSQRIEMRAGEFDVTPDMRIDFEGRKLKILAAWDPEERGRIIYIDCREWIGANDGE